LVSFLWRGIHRRRGPGLREIGAQLSASTQCGEKLAKTVCQWFQFVPLRKPRKPRAVRLHKSTASHSSCRSFPTTTTCLRLKNIRLLYRMQKLLHKSYRGPWRRLFLLCPPKRNRKLQAGADFARSKQFHSPLSAKGLPPNPKSANAFQDEQNSKTSSSGADADVDLPQYDRLDGFVMVRLPTPPQSLHCAKFPYDRIAMSLCARGLTRHGITRNCVEMVKSWS
jgi:hypothetical protein